MGALRATADLTYPGNLESDVVLRDGSTLSLRPVRPEDAPLLFEFFGSLDGRSLAFRFFTGAPNLRESARILADVDYRRRFGLVAVRGTDPRPVGHGFFAAFEGDRAEVAFAVIEELQGHGLGSILLAHLAERAAEAGISTFVAEVLPQNHSMTAMFRASGIPVEVHSEPEAVVVEMPTSLSREAVARFEERDRLASRAAVGSILDPEAVVLIDGPANSVLDRARVCAAAGTRAVVVRDELGLPDQDELLRICRGTGMRLVGPGSLGVLDTCPEHPLNLTPIRTPPPAGAVGVVTQSESGNAGREFLRLAAGRGLGISTFVSLGERTDITANDLLEFWEDDEATDVIVLQVESFSDPRRFARVARRVGRRKPIVVGTDGRADEPTARGLFDQVGVIHADGTEEMLDLATALSGHPLRQGSDATRVQAKIAAHAEPPRRGPLVATAPPAPRGDEAAAIIASSLAAADGELDREACAELLDCYGIHVEEGIDADPFAGRLRVTITADPLFGPVLACGPADHTADGDEAQICPLGEGDAAELLSSPAIREELGEGVDLRSLERTLERLAAAAAEHAEIDEIVLDPLLALPTGTVVRSGRIGVRRPAERRPWPRTWD